MKTLLLPLLAALVAVAYVAPRTVRAEDKDGKIVVVIKIPDDQQAMHKRTHP